MINLKKAIGGGINADDSLKLLGNDELLNMENMRVGISEFSKNFQGSNIQSTNLIYNVSLPYFNISFGRAVDYEKQRFIYCVYNSNGISQILCYDIPSQTLYIVLKEEQTASGFNWNADYRIARNAKVSNGLFIYTDNNNEPQCIDIEAGIKLNQPTYPTTVDPYLTPIPYTTLTLIKRPPVYPLSVLKITDSGFINNYTSLNAYQFGYFYTYKNNQNSALSAFSELVPLNFSAETYNAVDVYMQFAEMIDDYIQSVTFTVRYGNFGKTFEIRTWDKANYYDNLAIINHNASISQLGFRFYDNISGIAMDDVSANTSFDNVALKMKTIEFARNRLFCGDVLKGYDTPIDTSLSVTITTNNTGGAGSYPAVWKYMTIYYYFISNPATLYSYNLYYVYSATAPTNTAYYYSVYRTGSSLPTLLNAADADANWNTELNLAYYIIRNNIDVPFPGTRWSYYPSPTFNSTASSLTLVVSSTTSGFQFFKSSSTYNVTIAFFDRVRRKCGVVQKYIAATIIDRTYNQTIFDASLNWLLSNVNAVTEIPDWAYYYQMHISLNQTTRFFEQITSAGTDYPNKNQDGTFDYGHTTFTAGKTYAISFDLTPLFNFGLGYTFNQGDLCRVYLTDGTNVILPVLGVDGNNVLLQPQDIGTLGSSTTFLIELYTPYKPILTEPFYETGAVYPILNPTTLSRSYSTLSGIINGDAYAIDRGSYFSETMSPNDKVWQIWQTDTGWENIIDTIGQTRVNSKIEFSDTFINGSKVNGLNKFQPLNNKDIGGDSGGIQKLQLSNKQGEQIGTVMICIATTESLSIYLGETQLTASAQQAYISLSSDVIGSINALKSSRGTLNPESVIEYNGTIWWFDLINGVIAQYADNGISDISDFKMKSFFDHYAKKYSSLTSDQIKALCGFSYIESCIDPSTKELLFTLPQVEENVVTSGIPVGYAPALPSYTSLPSYASSIQNRFTFYDGQPKTVIYQYELNKWKGAYLWLPDLMEQVGNKLYGCKNGNLYLHNENPTSFNVIYDVQYPQRICFVANLDPSAVSDLFNTVLESNSIPNYMVAYVVYPDEQITDLTAFDFVNKEGILYAEWFRDRLSPNTTGTAEQRMYQGDVIKSATFLIMIEWQNYNSQLLVDFINLGMEISQGNSQILSNK